MSTRRSFVKQVAVAGAAVAIAPRFVWGHGAATAAPVVSFHMDLPYLDVTGHGIPYVPPNGMRSAEPLAQLSEEAFRCAFYSL